MRKCGVFSEAYIKPGVTVKMHFPKIVLPSNYLPGNKNSPVFFSQEIITPRSIYLLVKYHSLQEIWTPL